MTDQSVIELPEDQDRELWEFIPNMEKECLQFKVNKEMYPVDCDQAL
jgi:hypothetical protein